MSVVVLIGRILFAMIFIGSGVGGHLKETESTTGYADVRGVPGSKVLVQVSGVLMTLGALGVIFGVWIDLAALGLAAYALVAAFVVHHFWTDEGQMQQLEMTQFMKNLSMAGGALILFAFTATAGPALDFTITDPLFDFDL